MKIKHVDHIGIIVKDMAIVKEFFTNLGFELLGEAPVQGEWVERIIGLTNVKEDVAMLQAPDGQLNIELVKFHQPEDPAGIQPGAANTLGLRHIAFITEDVQEVVDHLQQKGYELVGEIQTFEDSWKLCYVRGPEGIIIELTQQLNR